MALAGGSDQEYQLITVGRARYQPKTRAHCGETMPLGLLRDPSYRSPDWGCQTLGRCLMLLPAIGSAPELNPIKL
jgi:hypothetical protein